MAVALLATQGAGAQVASGPDQAAVTDDSGDIIVTAQRRQERLQDVSASISAFGNRELERSNIVQFEQLAPRVPGFYLGGSAPVRPLLYIRGVGTRQFDPGSDPSVGAFMDDVYVGRSSGVLGYLKDIDRVEVLKGPQGTLYGRNTIAGAVNILTRMPTDSFEAEFQGGIGNYDAYNATGILSGPLAEGVRARVVVSRTYRDGFVRNLATGRRSQGEGNWSGRAKLAFDLSERLQLLLIGELFRDRTPSFQGINQGSVANPRAVFFQRPGSVPLVANQDYASFYSLDSRLRRDAKTGSAKLSYDGEGVDLVSITAYRRTKFSEVRDFDSTSLDAVDQRSSEINRQFTQELRLSSAAGGPLTFDDHVKWIVGAYYFHDHSTRSDAFRLGADSLSAALGGGLIKTDTSLGDNKTSSYAAFGQVDVTVLPRLTLALGVRYTSDKKKNVASGLTTGPGLPFIAGPFVAADQRKWHAVDPRAVLTYKWSDDAMTYASYSKGFKSGGFQFVPFSAAQAGVVFNPERVEAFEIGWKTQWADRRITFNGALFQYDYTNLQVARIVVLPTGAPTNLITNAAQSTIKGFETDLSARLGGGLEANISYAYLDAKYDRYFLNDPSTPSSPNTDISGTRMVRSPKHSVNVGLQYGLTIGDGKLTARGDWSVMTKFYHEPGEGRAAVGAGALALEPSYDIANFRLTYDRQTWSLSAFVNNALKEKYRRSIQAFGNIAVAFPGEPRMYGLTLTWRPTA